MILAIDTATRWLGLALHDGTAVLAEVGWHCKNNHTVELTPTIRELMTRMGATMADLSGIAIAVGPGSYTGLRVGMAVAKGLALAHQTPMVGVPTLDIVAAAHPSQPGDLVVVAEAGRTRVLTAVYQWHGGDGWQTNQTPEIDTWDELLTRLEGPLTFAGEISPEAAQKIRTSGKLFQLARAAASVRRAGFLAELGWQSLRRGDIDDVATLAPIYLRDPAGA
ncbi:MAG: tRNA (adenosine(37)-N6)-threonylcarbamoyltransferase complex dimerization subunit type 1 TsaB [Anaerolineales bacterium]|nr:tRNA (adenosine(37)-N6)-threonylcarbamoyltransferase complex dimerization subunit type 1 TsaB [Anaerolineales bacterium]